MGVRQFEKAAMGDARRALDEMQLSHIIVDDLDRPSQEDPAPPEVAAPPAAAAWPLPIEAPPVALVIIRHWVLVMACSLKL